MVLVVPATNVGAKAGPPQPVTVKGKLGVASGVSGLLHGVMSALVIASPQVWGLASGARGPPLSLSLRSLKGCCGVSLNVAVSWPVAGLAGTVPCTLITTPDPPSCKYR